MLVARTLIVSGAFALGCSSAQSTEQGAAPTGGAGAFAYGAGGNPTGSPGGAPGGGTPSGGGAPSGGGDPGTAGASGAGNPGGAGGGADVTFDWPTTVPGQGKPCKAGHYVGTFECLYQPAGTPDGSTGGLPITGPIDFTLAQSQNGEFLEVSGGSLDGLALIAIHFKAAIAGRLDCGSGAFAGDLQNGSYAIDPFPAGGTFVGPMNGLSSAAAPCTGTCLSGTWALHETGAAGTNHIGTCAGTWTATWQP